MKWILCAALLACSLTSQAEVRRDGTWWRALQFGERQNYLIGLVAGIRTQISSCESAFDPVSTIGDQKPLPVELWKFQRQVCRPALNTTNATFGQIQDGLNDFYSDYRNRSILVEHAAAVVLDSIHGEAQASKNLTDYWRLRDGAQ